MFARCLLLIAAAAALAPSPALADAAADQYKVGAGHYARERWGLAIEEFRLFLDDHPEHDLAGNAAFYLGEALVQSTRYGESRDQFRQFLADFPRHRFAAQASFRSGEAAYLLGDYPSARQDLEAFRQGHADDPLNAYVLPYLGEMALTEEEHEQARDFFDESLTRFPTGGLQDECRFGLARALEKLGDLDRAERLLLALASKTASPLAGDAQFHLAALLYGKADYPAALEAFAELQARFPDSPHRGRAELGRGWCEFQLGHYSEAAAIFTSLTERPELALEAGYWLGLTEKARENWLAAAETLARLAAPPEHELAAAIAFHAGDARWRSGDGASAAPHFDGVLEAWPSSEWADDSLLGRMQIALEAGDAATIEQLAARLPAEYRDSQHLAEARRLLARSRIARQQFAEAIALLTPAVAVEGPSPTDQYLLAVSYHGAKRFDEALPLFDALLAAPAASADLVRDARLAKALSLIALSRHADAAPLLEEALPLLTEAEAEARCRAQLALCRAKTGDWEQARRHYADLTAQHAGSETLLPTALHLAETAEAAGEDAWAAELFTGLSAAEMPADYAVPGLLGLAWGHFHAGDFERSQAALEQLLNRYPDDPRTAEASVLRAQSLAKLSRDADALAMYLAAIATNPTDGDLLAAALLGAARLQTKAERPAEAAALLDRLATEFPDYPARDLVLYDWAWALLGSDRAAEAAALFAKLREDYPHSARWGDATYRLAERAYQAQDYDRAGELLAELVASHAAAEVHPSAHYLRGQIAAAQQQWPEVAAAMSAAVTAAPEGPLRAHAEFWIAESLYRRNEHTAALAALQALSARPDAAEFAFAPLVLLRKSQVLALLERWTEARQAAEQAVESFPDFEQRYELDYVLGRCFASQAEFDLARQAYRRVVRSPQGEGTEAAARAQFMIGETYFHQRDYAPALRELLRVEILYDYPTWQAASLLEAAKCYERLEQWRPAVELYDRLLTDFPETELREEAARRLAAARVRLAAAR